MILAQSTAFRKSVLSQMGALEMIQQKNSFPGGVRPIPLSSAQSDSQVPVGMEGQIRRGAHETIPQLGGQVPWLFTLRRGPVQWTKRVNVSWRKAVSSQLPIRGRGLSPQSKSVTVFRGAFGGSHGNLRKTPCDQLGPQRC